MATDTRQANQQKKL